MRDPLPASFRQCVEDVFGKDKVLVTAYAKPSQPIKQWYKDWQPPEGIEDAKPETNGSLYEGLINVTRRAIREQPIDTVTYIWMQGEADAGKGWGSVYEKSFLGVLDQLKEDLAIEDINFVVGRINDYWSDAERFPDGQLVRRIQQKLGEENTNGDWINTDDLNRGVNPWGGFSFDDGHFPPAGYTVMGQRFAKKACRLIDPQIEMDPEIFEEVFFDSSSNIQSHAAIGKSVTGPKSEQATAAGGSGFAELTDGEFAESDQKSKQWISFAPREESIDLIIDLGKAIEIDSVGINTLLSSQAKAGFPNRFIISTSGDGESFAVNNSRYNSIHFYNKKKLREMRAKGISPQTILLLTDQRERKKRVQARFIKIEIQTGEQWVYIDEIIVNPSKK
ncbi:MAG: sialate O-acetylesterase [Phycisphaeraceae bacterium]